MACSTSQAALCKGMSVVETQVLEPSIEKPVAIFLLGSIPSGTRLENLQPEP